MSGWRVAVGGGWWWSYGCRREVMMTPEGEAEIVIFNGEIR
jgi:hypothetical protein